MFYILIIFHEGPWFLFGTSLSHFTSTDILTKKKWILNLSINYGFFLDELLAGFSKSLKYIVVNFSTISKPDLSFSAQYTTC